MALAFSTCTIHGATERASSFELQNCRITHMGIAWEPTMEDGIGHPVILFCPVETGLQSGSPWVGKNMSLGELDPTRGWVICSVLISVQGYRLEIGSLND